jgi:tRNA dimethylallyltransferase
MTTKILVIGGVTAAGKTAAALALARRQDGELVGADSVQVYRGFDIGSAKPTAAELGGVRHHLIDVIDPDAEIDAARYAALADAAIADIASRGKLPIVVGGTGLWIRALLRGLVELPEVDPTLRTRLDGEADEIGAPALHERLRAIDPAAAARIHPNDRLRVVRALEVYEQTGRPLGELQAAHALGAPRYDAEIVLLDRPREELHAAIRARVEGMIDAGWIDEVRGLLARWGPDVRPMSAVGYRQIAEHVLTGVPLEETERAIYKATRIYTRRQRTWFRGDHRGVPWTTARELTVSSGEGA